jgi:hypothetical protein
MASSFRTSTAKQGKTARRQDWPKGPTGQPLGVTKAEVLAFLRYLGELQNPKDSTFEMIDGAPRRVSFDEDVFLDSMRRGGPTRAELTSAIDKVGQDAGKLRSLLQEIFLNANRKPEPPLLIVFKRRLEVITHGDFDGLASAAYLKNKEKTSKPVTITVPNAIQDRVLSINGNNVILDLPYHEDCSVYFDHHKTNEPPEGATFEGLFQVAPSAARVLTIYYGDSASYHMNDLVKAADRIDTGKLTADDFMNPRGYVKVSVTVRFWDSGDANYKNSLIEWLRFQDPDQIMKNPAAAERFKKRMEEYDDFRKSIGMMAKVHGKVLLIDFRSLKNPPIGPNVLIEDAFQNCQIILRVGHSPERPGSVNIIASHNSLNSENAPDVGELMCKYGGGGHRWGAGTTISAGEANRVIREIIRTLNG